MAFNYHLFPGEEKKLPGLSKIKVLELLDFDMLGSDKFYFLK